MKRLSKKTRVVLWILIAFVFLYIFVFPLFYLDGQLRYAPLSGRVLKLEAEEISSIWLQSGVCGEYIELTEPEEIQPVVDAINSFRCRFHKPVVMGWGGWSYRFVIRFRDGTSYSIQFHENTLRGDRCILWGQKGHFLEYTTLIDEYIQTVR